MKNKENKENKKTKNHESTHVELVDEILRTLLITSRKVATAESCTAGLFSGALTETKGASGVFDMGLSCYSNQSKNKLLGVPMEIIDEYGAVSPTVAAMMAAGVREKAVADIGIGITGIAGPDGGTEEKPVGTIYIGLSVENKIWVEKLSLTDKSETRETIRGKTVDTALKMLKSYLAGEAENQFDIFEYSTEMTPEKLAIFEQLKTEQEETDRLETEQEENEMNTLNEKLPENENTDANINDQPKNIFTRFFTVLRNFFIPWKGDGALEIVRKCMIIGALIVFTVSAIYVAGYYLKGIEGDKMIQDIAETYYREPTSEELAGLPDKYLDKFASLYAINKDIKGWINIPGTSVDYPVVQYYDNNHYLRRDFNGDENELGVPYIDFRNEIEKDEFSTNTIIYSHNIRTGQFFAQLTNYKEAKYYNENPTITFDTIYNENEWVIFGVFMATVDEKDGPVFKYHNFVNKVNDEHFEWYIDQVQKRSIINTNVDINVDDKLLTLSTCDYDLGKDINARFVVVARMRRPGENLYDIEATANPKPWYPNLWYDKYGIEMPEEFRNLDPNFDGDVDGIDNPNPGYDLNDDHITPFSVPDYSETNPPIPTYSNPTYYSTPTARPSTPPPSKAPPSEPESKPSTPSKASSRPPSSKPQIISEPPISEPEETSVEEIEISEPDETSVEEVEVND